jgi:hypothetical protein
LYLIVSFLEYELGRAIFVSRANKIDPASDGATAAWLSFMPKFPPLQGDGIVGRNNRSEQSNPTQRNQKLARRPKNVLFLR